MDTTRENLNINYRAITSPILHHRIYWFIITMEVIYTACCLTGTYQLFKYRHAGVDEFHESKKLSIVGLLIAIFVYYVCIQVIGVEWFDMDESKLWNAKDWARHAVDFIVPLLIFLTLKIER
jgi:predicted small integral membrane protein